MIKDKIIEKIKTDPNFGGDADAALALAAVEEIFNAVEKINTMADDIMEIRNIAVRFAKAYGI